MTFGMGELLLSFEKLWRETFECGWVMSLWGGVGGSFSRTAAIFDWAPLLLKTMAMMIGIDLGVKTLIVISFQNYFYPLRIKCLREADVSKKCSFF